MVREEPWVKLEWNERIGNPANGGEIRLLGERFRNLFLLIERSVVTFHIKHSGVGVSEYNVYAVKSEIFFDKCSPDE